MGSWRGSAFRTIMPEQGSDVSNKIVLRAARAVPRSPEAPSKMRMPGYSGYIPGAQSTIEQNYFQVTRKCYDQMDKRKGLGHGSGNEQPSFAANSKPRLHTAPPGAGAAKFLPGYGGFIPGCRFKFETSEGTLAKTWAPRRPDTHGGGSVIRGNYQAAKPRPKLHNDKYIIGYTGQLPGAQNQIELSYARVARGVENGTFKPVPTVIEKAGAMAPPSYTHKAMPTAPPDYKLPGYTGYIPQVKYTFEQRYSASTDSAAAGITGGAGYRFGGGTHLNR